MCSRNSKESEKTVGVGGLEEGRRAEDEIRGQLTQDLLAFTRSETGS